LYTYHPDTILYIYAKKDVRTALFWVITQRAVVIYYRHFGITNISVPSSVNKTLGFLTTEDGAIGCPETTTINYHYSLRNNPEERSSHLLRGRSLKSRKDVRLCGYISKTKGVREHKVWEILL
jgi:hypothetical protein